MAELRRIRRREPILKRDPDARGRIAQRVRKFYEADTQSRNIDRDVRLQRYAKYRQWTEGKTFPWDGSSDAALPDVATQSFRVQDTLHNAVMSTRPIVTSKAINENDREKQEKIDLLHDWQFFVEQPGEQTIEEAAELFVNDPCVTIFTPWVEEYRKRTIVEKTQALPMDQIPAAYFEELMRARFGDRLYRPISEEGWDWEVLNGLGEPSTKVHFYSNTDGSPVEVVIEETVQAFNGPRPMVMSYDDVLTPPRVANLQAPTPSNPGGSPHVILTFRPTVDEVRRLYDAGVYDLLTKEDVDRIEKMAPAEKFEDSLESQKDAIQGEASDLGHNHIEPKHKRLTMLVCFDIYDVDGDGKTEDVIWWVIPEAKVLARAKRLTEVYPFSVPRRPFAESSFLPVKGRRAGISLIESIEGLHDLMKSTMDLMIDSGTMASFPFGFYRAASTVNPEVLRPYPGDLMPMANPKEDIFFPNMSASFSQSFGFNMYSLISQMGERLTMQGDLQFGRVPAGKSSALRTLGGMQTVMSQGEARPQRILRRFYRIWTEVWAQMHELNQQFLPESKRFRVTGYVEPGRDPYVSVSTRNEIQGRFMFDFNANLFNSSQMALQQSLTELMNVAITDLAVNLGISDADSIYRLIRDYAKAVGADPNMYLNRPTPGADVRRLLWQDVLDSVLGGRLPDGVPAEPAQEHLMKLQEFLEGDRQGKHTGIGQPLMDSQQMQLLQMWMVNVSELARQEAAIAQRAAAAGKFNSGGPGAGAAPPAPVDGGPTMVSENELLDETLPGSGTPQ